MLRELRAGTTSHLDDAIFAAIGALIDGQCVRRKRWGQPSMPTTSSSTITATGTFITTPMATVRAAKVQFGTLTVTGGTVDATRLSP